MSSSLTLSLLVLDFKKKQTWFSISSRQASIDFFSRSSSLPICFSIQASFDLSRHLQSIHKINMIFDIQVEIIKKLPIRSLIQFRSVCKAWKSLIDSFQFIAGYNDYHDHHVVVLEEGEIEIKYVSLVGDDVTFPQQMFPPLVQPKTQIFGSSHGLLFLAEYDPTFLVIWNPTIRRSVAVVVPPTPNPVDKRFDFVVGFGVCPDTKDPILVKMTFIRDSGEIESISSIPSQVMVFTLSSGEWKSICSSNLPSKSITVEWIQTVVGRFIYWVAFDGWIDEDGKFGYCRLIISFDMSTREFREVDLPDSMTELPEGGLSVSRLRESLAVVEYSYVDYGTDSGKQVCNVWVMKEHGDFTKLYTINVPNMSVIWIWGFTKSGEAILEIEDDFRAASSTSTLVVYEPCSDHIKDIGIHGIRRLSGVSSDTESLLLLDHDDGHIYE